MISEKEYLFGRTDNQDHALIQFANAVLPQYSGGEDGDSAPKLHSTKQPPQTVYSKYGHHAITDLQDVYSKHQSTKAPHMVVENMRNGVASIQHEDDYEDDDDDSQVGIKRKAKSKKLTLNHKVNHHNVKPVAEPGSVRTVPKEEMVEYRGREGFRYLLGERAHKFDVTHPRAVRGQMMVHPHEIDPDEALNLLVPKQNELMTGKAKRNYSEFLGKRYGPGEFKKKYEHLEKEMLQDCGWHEQWEQNEAVTANTSRGLKHQGFARPIVGQGRKGLNNVTADTYHHRVNDQLLNYELAEQEFQRTNIQKKPLLSVKQDQFYNVHSVANRNPTMNAVGRNVVSASGPLFGSQNLGLVENLTRPKHRQDANTAFMMASGNPLGIQLDMPGCIHDTRLRSHHTNGMFNSGQAQPQISSDMPILASAQEQALSLKGLASTSAFHSMHMYGGDY